MSPLADVSCREALRRIPTTVAVVTRPHLLEASPRIVAGVCSEGDASIILTLLAGSGSDGIAAGDAFRVDQISTGKEAIADAAAAGAVVAVHELDDAAATTFECTAIEVAVVEGATLVRAVIDRARTRASAEPSIRLRDEYRRIEELPAAMFPGLHGARR